jgi:carboxylesterase type B
MNDVVSTRYGLVRGSAAEGVHAFKGVAYAAPPFGVDRFQAPRRVGPWSGVRDALVHGPTPPQLTLPPPFDVIMPMIPGEDCLNLNIWSPDLGSARLPVLVWIPGGAFEAGGAVVYEGSRFARDGVVCVTVNYRVGSDGFLALGDGVANLGLLDQVAALEWVQENIAAFGGDPGNVTIFGESAGATSVATLLSMPRAEGLFHRAIAQSPVFGTADQLMSAATAREVGRLLARTLGVEATREAVAAVPLERLLAAQAEMKADLMAHPDPQRWGGEVLTSMMLWQPVIDGDVVPARPFDRIAAGAGADVEVVVGTNVDEWRLFLASTGAIEQVTAEALAAAVAGYGLPVDPTLAAYRTAHPGAGPGDLLAAVQTDWYCRLPAIRLADAHATSRRSATYMYEFAWRSPQFNGLLGACHGLEIDFVFDTIGKDSELLLGTDPPQELADMMHAAWVSFAATGDCGWSAYDPVRRATMRFDAVSGPVDDPRSVERALWDGVR